MKDENLKVGDELIWGDGSRSVVLALYENTFYEITQFGYVYEQCYPDGHVGYRRSGRNFAEIGNVLKKMEEASEV